VVGRSSSRRRSDSLFVFSRSAVAAQETMNAS
jgi:hypothetical protein